MKRLFAGILCICFLVSMVLVGCAPTSPAAPAAPAPGAPAETTGPNIKIAVVGPMTFIMGEHNWVGAKIAADEINEAGGVNVGGVKRKIELVKVDTNEMSSIPDAVLAVERAISTDKVDFLVGGYRSEAAIAYHETACKAKKIIMSPPCGDKSVLSRVRTDYDHYKYSFRIGGGNTGIVATMIPFGMEFLVNEVRKATGIDRPKIAILGIQAAWPTQFIDVVKSKHDSWGADIVGEWRPSMTSSDLTAELTAIKSAGAQIIFTTLGGPINVVFGKQYGELQIPAAPMGWSVEASDKGYWKATGGNCNYEATTGVYAPGVKATERSLPFYEKFAKLTNGGSPQQSAATYTGVWVIKECIEKAGTLDSDKIVIEIENIKFPAPEGIAAYWKLGEVEEKRDDVHSQKIGPGFTTGFWTQWQNGELVAVWPPADGSYGGARSEGIKSYVVPPHVVQYWKK